MSLDWRFFSIKKPAVFEMYFFDMPEDFLYEEQRNGNKCYNVE